MRARSDLSSANMLSRFTRVLSVGALQSVAVKPIEMEGRMRDKAGRTVDSSASAAFAGLLPAHRIEAEASDSTTRRLTDSQPSFSLVFGVTLCPVIGIDGKKLQMGSWSIGAVVAIAQLLMTK